MREGRGGGSSPIPPVPPASFPDKKACEDHLKRRFLEAGRRCPHCGSDQGSWLQTRRRWQCACCKRQVGLTAGTVMAGSRWPLTKWFTAIGVLVTRPEVTLEDLRRAVGVRRLATVRQVAAKVQAAIGSDNATELLAGLDRIFLPLLKGLTEQSVLGKATSAKRTPLELANEWPEHNCHKSLPGNAL